MEYAVHEMVAIVNIANFYLPGQILSAQEKEHFFNNTCSVLLPALLL